MPFEKAKPKKKRLGEVGGYWGKQGFGGYAGLKFTAREIVEYIPIRKVYVEPFAGLGRTAEYVREYEQMILNDKSDYALEELKKRFKLKRNVIITNTDYMECIRKYDSEDTVFLLDPPWVTNVYTENALTFCDRPAYQYYDEIIEELPNIKGEWILCSSAEGVGATRMKKCNYELKEITSKKNSIFGEKARTLLMAKSPFFQHRKESQSIEDFLK